MKRSVKISWASALRSGDYIQGDKDNGYERYLSPDGRRFRLSSSVSGKCFSPGLGCLMRLSIA
jgi:hypothetical protein